MTSPLRRLQRVGRPVSFADLLERALFRCGRQDIGRRQFAPAHLPQPLLGHLRVDRVELVLAGIDDKLVHGVAVAGGLERAAMLFDIDNGLHLGVPVGKASQHPETLAELAVINETDNTEHGFSSITAALQHHDVGKLSEIQIMSSFCYSERSGDHSNKTAQMPDRAVDCRTEKGRAPPKRAGPHAEAAAVLGCARRERWAPDRRGRVPHAGRSDQLRSDQGPSTASAETRLELLQSYNNMTCMLSYF